MPAFKRSYTRAELELLRLDAEAALAGVLKGDPAHVRTTVLMDVLRARLDEYGGTLPLGLLPLLDIVRTTHATYAQLCTEGLERVS